MPTYYKYAERSAESQVNWAEIGKSVSTMLQDENKVREEKKTAIDNATREFGNTLAASPQGKFQDANKFTNDYVAAQQQTRLMDDKLLKNGTMDLKTYTYRRQNGIDGTKTLFDLQKSYQEAYDTRMKGLTDGSLQAFNGFNMSEVEGFGDFSKSKAVIDPTTGLVNVGIMRPNSETGVLELTKDVIPANILMGKIKTTVPTFDVNSALDNAKKSQGALIESIYQAATTSGAGTITELTGVGAVKKYGQWTEAISLFNDGLSKMTDSFFSNPYNLMSVLTENTGNYHQDSYTYDLDVAKNDPTKILLKQNTSTGLGVIDENGPNYKDQKDEAEDWVKTSFKQRLDAEKKVQVTSQLNESAETKERAAYKYRTTGAGNEEPVKAIVIGEPLRTKGQKLDGIATTVENLTIPEAKGVDNYIEAIGYNNSNGLLELSGYQTSGRQTEGLKKSINGGKVYDEGLNVVKKQKFLKNDVNSAGLLAKAVTKIPNPERPGYNFSNINEAKNYYKRLYESTPSSAPANANKTIQFDSQGNIIE